MKCKGVTKKNRKCKNYAMVGEEYCRLHLGKQSPPKRQSPPKKSSSPKEKGVATEREYELFLKNHGFLKTRRQPDVLRMAIYLNRLDIVKYLVASGTVNIREYPDILEYTVRSGKLETLKYLVRIMGDRYVGKYDTHGKLLLEAVNNDKMDVIEYLFDELGFTVKDVAAHDYAALLIALNNNKRRIYLYLVDKGITKSYLDDVKKEHDINRDAFNDARKAAKDD